MSNKQSTFIEEATRRHGDTYDYSQAVFTRAIDKVKILCRTHGPFLQTAREHLTGADCPKCAVLRRTSARTYTAEQFVEKARLVHGQNYDYSGVVYINSQTKVTVVCPLHGEFATAPSKHLLGNGCPECGDIRTGQKRRLTEEQFLGRAKAAWGETYDYSHMGYTKATSPITIRCRIHGYFQQSPLKHMAGQGCSACGKIRSSESRELTQTEFIQRCADYWGDTYDYSKVEYTGIYNKIVIGCREHGPFEQQANSHSRGSGCPLCAGKRISKTASHTRSRFIEKARSKHGEKYDYKELEYTGDANKVTIVCPLHGAFEQRATSHLQGHGCTACAKGTPTKQREIAAYVGRLGFSPKINDRTLISPKELDIVIPERGLAIELNGVFWHSLTASSPSQEKFNHLNKFSRCREIGLSLLQITDLEWSDPTKQFIWRSIISSRLGSHKRRVFARNTEATPIGHDDANFFLAEHHLQGPTQAASKNFGLLHEGELVAVMTFAQHEGDSLNLTRLAFPTDITVVGGASKLFSFALQGLPPLPIVTFSNNRYSNGGLYPKMGFVKDADLPPSYEWWFRKELMNKRRCRHKHLPKLLGDLYDPSLTEHQNMFRAGARCLYDAGYQRWIFYRTC